MRGLEWNLIAIIVISLMIVTGFAIMVGAIFSKKKDIEALLLYGVADLFELNSELSLFLFICPY